MVCSSGCLSSVCHPTNHIQAEGKCYLPFIQQLAGPQLYHRPTGLLNAVQEIKQYSVWSDNTLNMATTLQDVTEAEARPLAEGFQKGSICPCCNSSTCTSVDWGRSVAEGVRQEQAKQLRKTADLLKQAFQTVPLHTVTGLACHWLCAVVHGYSPTVALHEPRAGKFILTSC